MHWDRKLSKLSRSWLGLFGFIGISLIATTPLFFDVMSFGNWMQSPFEAIKATMNFTAPTEIDNATTTTTATTTTASSTSSATFTTTPKPYYHESDCERYMKWSQRKHESCEHLPRVLIFTWVTNDTYKTFAEFNYWKSCYAHLHGFDVIYTDEGSPRKQHRKGVPKTEEEKHKYWYTDELMWAWLPAFKRYFHEVVRGHYDYVLLSGGDVQISEYHQDWPVWAWDQGHDLTIMDQDFFSFGINENHLLFRVSSDTSFIDLFIDTMLSYKGHNCLQGDNGPFMETMLVILGKEAEEDRRRAYNESCRERLFLEMPAQNYLGSIHYENLNENYSKCFFAELERFTGPVNERKSRYLGFSRNDRRDIPWANCWSYVVCCWHWYPGWCFAYHYNGQREQKTIEGSCPDPTFNWNESIANPKKRKALFKTTTTTTTFMRRRKLKDNEKPPYYFDSDCERFMKWPHRRGTSCDDMPRVLIFTWVTNNTYQKYENFNYWKSCYAHLHGYDVVFTDEGAAMDSYWYSEDNMWAWLPALKRYWDEVLPGNYDYVLLSGGDVLISEYHRDFPLWAYDQGHDLTFMDNGPFPWGINLNHLLFRVSSSTDFIDLFVSTMLSHRKWHCIQGDNGPFMETLLIILGREAEEDDRAGYSKTCQPKLILDDPAEPLLGTTLYQQINENYTTCFFEHLGRLAGPENQRKSKYIGFTRNDVKEIPWVNCWGIATCCWHWYPGWCFAYHYNGQQAQKFIEPACPDPTFDWHNSIYNPKNRPTTTTTTTLIPDGIPYYYDRDCALWQSWSKRPESKDRSCESMPQVLIFTWVPKGTLDNFETNNHWKACYANMHGYDVVFTDEGSKSSDGTTAENMWAWMKVLQRYLTEVAPGRYDYILVSASDVVISEHHLEFPLWAYDEGHDLMIMDQPFFDWGINGANLLFRVSNSSILATKQFFELVFKHRKRHCIQESNGALMEAMLVTLGREAEESGRPGYNKTCQSGVFLKQPARSLLGTAKYLDVNRAYSLCFFPELERLAGPENRRKSKYIGFVKNSNGREIPWMNCWYIARCCWHMYPGWCFAYSGPSPGHTGQCYKTFNWKKVKKKLANRITTATEQGLDWPGATKRPIRS